MLATNGHANGHANRIPLDPTPEEIAARAEQERAARNGKLPNVRPVAVQSVSRPATKEVLSPIEQAIIAVVTDVPQSPKTIARLAGYKPISIGRALTSLCRKRLVVRTPDGYTLAELAPAPYKPPMVKAILAVVSQYPATAKQLAAKSGYKCNSSFRGQLSELVRSGELAHTPDGYTIGNGRKLPPKGIEEELAAIRKWLRRIRRFMVGVIEKQGDPRNVLITSLSPCKQAILQAATVTPQTAKQLAKRSGYSLSRVRDSITDLTELELLIRVPRGLKLPGRVG